MLNGNQKELAPRRLDNLRELIRGKGVIRVEEICSRLRVSPATVRRDLDQLEEAGTIRRVHGGAVSVDSRLEEPLFDDFVANGLIDRLDEWPNLQLERIPTNEHIFSPLWCQRYVHELLDGAIERTLSHRAARSISD